MMTRLLLLAGDGIGPEVTAQAVRVLQYLSERFTFPLTIEEGLIGGVAYDAHGHPFPEATVEKAKACDVVLLGAVGHPKYDMLEPASLRPEQGLLQIRKTLGLYANLRPVKLFSCLKQASTLKPEVLEGVDMLVVRELTGGLYFGQPKERTADKAIDTLVYERHEIERIARLAFELARQRRKAVCSVDKANVLVSSQLWRDVVNAVHQDYPEVALTHQYVDNTAMQLIRQPAQYDVLLTENTFGDILSDEASMLTGSLGMLASASIGVEGKALYEPSHGSAPDIAGQDKANPIATLLSVVLMLQSSLNQPKGAQQLEAAIEFVLKTGWRTADLAEASTPPEKILGCSGMGDKVLEALKAMAVLNA
jgi:3-isopropylmalate dehydrogenase